MTEIANQDQQVDTKQVYCDGGEGAMGHPRIYLNMGVKEEVVCPYCNKKFIFKNQN